jgi:hypothetical protein
LAYDFFMPEFGDSLGAAFGEESAALGFRFGNQREEVAFDFPGVFGGAFDDRFVVWLKGGAEGELLGTGDFLGELRRWRFEAGGHEAEGVAHAADAFAFAGVDEARSDDVFAGVLPTVELAVGKNDPRFPCPRTLVRFEQVGMWRERLLPYRDFAQIGFDALVHLVQWRL